MSRELWSRQVKNPMRLQQALVRWVWRKNDRPVHTRSRTQQQERYEFREPTVELSRCCLVFSPNRNACFHVLTNRRAASAVSKKLV